MRIFKQRILVIVAATALAAACGTLAGYLLGRALTLRHAETRLQPYAERISTEADITSTEAREELATIDASPFPACSPQEIAWLHKMVFQSEHLKDAGRVLNGKIACSATLDRLDEPGPLTTPKFSLPDGTTLYQNLPEFRIGNQTVITIQRGAAYAVYSPYNLKNLGSDTMHFTVTDVDAATRQAGRLVGEVAQAPMSILTRDGEARQDDTMYFTLCSARYSSCITTYISVPEALRVNRGEFRA